MKAAIYARTATLEQSTLDQIELCREYIKEQGWTVVGIYDDEGVSAHDPDRDGLKTLMENAFAKRFDVLVVTSFSRLFRNPLEFTEFLSRLGQLRIQLVEVKG